MHEALADEDALSVWRLQQQVGARLDQAVERFAVFLIVEELAVRGEGAGHVVRHARLELARAQATAGPLAAARCGLAARGRGGHRVPSELEARRRTDANTALPVAGK